MDRPKTIPFLSHEAETARLERIIKRLWILIIIIFSALILTNGAWIWYESQWEVVEETTEEYVTQDVDNKFGDTVVAGIGDVYGSGKTDSKKSDYKAVSQKEEVND